MNSLWQDLSSPESQHHEALFYAMEQILSLADAEEKDRSCLYPEMTWNEDEVDGIYAGQSVS
jgi:hypothetical protein